MRTEYILTDAQKARINQINDQIIALNIELAGIYEMARIRCVAEHDDNIDAMIQGSLYRYAMCEPVIKQDAIVKLNFEGLSEVYEDKRVKGVMDDRGTEETGGGEP